MTVLQKVARKLEVQEVTNPTTETTAEPCHASLFRGVIPHDFMGHLVYSKGGVEFVVRYSLLFGSARLCFPMLEGQYVRDICEGIRLNITDDQCRRLQNDYLGLKPTMIDYSELSIKGLLKSAEKVLNAHVEFLIDRATGMVTCEENRAPAPEHYFEDYEEPF